MSDGLTDAKREQRQIQLRTLFLTSLLAYCSKGHEDSVELELDANQFGLTADDVTNINEKQPESLAKLLATFPGNIGSLRIILEGTRFAQTTIFPFGRLNRGGEYYTRTYPSCQPLENFIEQYPLGKSDKGILTLNPTGILEVYAVENGKCRRVSLNNP